MLIFVVELDTYYEVLDIIHQRGVDVNTKNYLGETPLMQAASKGNEDAVKWLLDHKADYKDANLYVN
jgi:ankyrin repeat protein